MSTSQQITEELRRWIVAQAQAGHTDAQILQAMRDSGWEESVAFLAMQEVLLNLMKTASARDAAAADAALVLPHVSADGHLIWAHDKHVKVLTTLDHPRVVVLANVLSEQECDELIEAARPHLIRSETVQDATGDGEVNESRTSQGMFFGRQESPLIERIEARLSALMNWPTERGEGLQILRYAPGAQYRPHYDYFDPQLPGTAAVLKRGGQRVGTMVMYLNTPQEGGATTFPDIGMTVHAAKGHAVFFSYALPLPATKTLHGGAPVTRGEKWVATKWWRQQRFD